MTRVPAVGAPLGRHRDVTMVSFTGSADTGRLFLQYAAESNLKRVVLECGGKNPAVVLADVRDLDTVARHLVNGAFWKMGENCSASSRLIVHADVKQPLLERIGVQMREWTIGNPLDPDHRLRAMVSQAHFDKVRSYLACSAKRYSARCCPSPRLPPVDEAITTPFGGYKESGFGGRDKSQWAHDQYTEIKTIRIDAPA